MSDPYHGYGTVIREAIADARSKGVDDIGQNGRAVRAIKDIDTDMTASAALALVRLWQGKYG